MTDSLEEFLRSQMRHETARIRASGDIWADAMSKGRRLRRRRRSMWFGVGATAAALTIAGGALSGSFDGDTLDAPRSPITQSPSTSPEPKRRVHILLDTVELDDGRRLELVAWGPAWGLTSKEDGGPCLRITGIDELSRECGNAPSERVPPVHAPILATPVAQRSASAPFEVYGETSAAVTEVVVRYSSGGQSKRVRAELFRGTDRSVLDEAGIAEPFGYFFAELPAGTTADAVQAIAFDSQGQRLGSDDYADMPLRAFISGPTRR